MKRVLAVLAVTSLMGCESAVLVNNRPEREPDYNAPAAQQQPETASATTPPDNANGAQTASDRQNADADQTVETKDIRIESQSR